MTFNKASVGGKSYGDPVDDTGHRVEFTDVSV